MDSSGGAAHVVPTKAYATVPSTRLTTIAKYEFARKTRQIDHLTRFKATEFSLILLYVGPVVLHNYLPAQCLIHFISLHCAMRILCHETDCKNNNAYAKSLLSYTCPALYISVDGNKPILVGKLLKNSTNFPGYPIDSELLNIVVGN